MTSARQILPNYTYEDYCQWEGRWELIGGIPHAMSPAPSPYHQKISAQLSFSLLDSLRKKPGNCPCEVYDPIDIKIDEHTVVQPDLSIVCKPIEQKFLDFPPVLAAEILSPSTRDKDLISKYALYQKFGVKYYLIIDPDEKSITSFVLDDGKYVQSEELEFLLYDNFVISPDFSSLF